MITDPAKLTQALLATPYRERGSGWAGIDCWGLVELWFANRFGITLTDRTGLDFEDGIEAGFAMRGSCWVPVEEPKPDDLVILRTTRRNVVVEHGHCGIYTVHGLLHADRPLIRLEDYETRRIAGRVTGLFRHKSLI